MVMVGTPLILPDKSGSVRQSEPLYRDFREGLLKISKKLPYSGKNHTIRRKILKDKARIGFFTTKGKILAISINWMAKVGFFFTGLSREGIIRRSGGSGKRGMRRVP